MTLSSMDSQLSQSSLSLGHPHTRRTQPINYSNLKLANPHIPVQATNQMDHFVISDEEMNAMNIMADPNLVTHNLSPDVFGPDFTSSPLYKTSCNIFEMADCNKGSDMALGAGLVCRDQACQCGQSFARPSERQKHLDQRARPYTCSAAGCRARPFGAKSDLKRHEREVHRVSALLFCPVTSCKRHTQGFARKENLNAHIRNMHPRGTSSEPLSDASQSQPLSRPSTGVSASHTPIVAGPSSLSSSPSPGGSLPSRVSSDTALRIGLLDRLGYLREQRLELQQQMDALDDQIDAVRRTVEGLGSVEPCSGAPTQEATMFKPDDLLM